MTFPKARGIENRQTTEGSKAPIAVLGEKASNVTSAGLKAWVKRRKTGEKEGSSSAMEKDSGVEVIQPTSRWKPPKRKKVEGTTKERVDLSKKVEGEETYSSEALDFHRGQKVLHLYREEDNSESLWDESFQIEGLADRVAQAPKDCEMVEQVDDMCIDHYLQVIGARLLNIGRTQQLRHLKEKSDVAVLKEVTARLKEKEQALAEMVEEVKGKDIWLLDMKKQIDDMKKEVEAAESDSRKLKDEVKRLEDVVEKKEGSLYEAFTDGFERAVSQVKVVAPEADLSGLDMLKIVVDGALVDDGSPAEEEDKTIPDPKN